MFTPQGKFYIALIVVGVVLIGGGVFLFFTTSAPVGESENERFIISLDMTRGEAIDKLHENGFIKNTWAFNIIYAEGVVPGAYTISQSMNAFELAHTLREGPYMKWVVIPEGFRKEQMAELFGSELGWDKEIVSSFILESTEGISELPEGVFFPDTYLIALDEGPDRVAKRLHDKFNEVFAPYLKEALAQNIRWPTLVKIASLVQREASGKDDMSLIAGILWNRLLSGDRLQIDATVQYVRDTLENYSQDENGKLTSYVGDFAQEKGWWSPIRVEDKEKDIFKTNTYRNSGLPGRPIANPGKDAFEAVLFPEETPCFFYLHDRQGEIHCSVTYEGHIENIEKYLR